jgi:AraC-like DNA-binding protein
MKSIQEQLLIPDDEIFLLKRNQEKVFSRPRHHHRELEIKYMVSGSGRGFVGETIYEYQTGDLVLLGPNLPHHWVSDNHYEEKGILADCFYLQFKEDFLGDTFLHKTATLSIAELFQRARSGIQFSGKTAIEAAHIIENLTTTTGIRRLILFIELLNLLAQSYEYRDLNNKTIFPVNKKEQEDALRLNKIYQFIYTNFKDEISLADVADLVKMSKPAFCSYFKNRTLKNFTEFVNEVRIAHAQKLLIESDFAIKEIGYEVGFNNISLFNRVFKKVTKQTPKDYKKQFEKQNYHKNQKNV